MKADKILIVDDEQMIRWMLCQTMKEWSFVPVEATNVQSALKLFNSERPDLTLLDINLPDGSGLDVLREIKQLQPDALVIMINANVMVEHTIAALRSGAYDFITKPINLEQLKVTIENALQEKHSTEKLQNVVSEPESDFSFENIIGESPEMHELITIARKVAKKNVSSILLQGESGTGKDLIAKAIHFSSPRAAKPFIAINCAAIPENLIESELFGYEKGSFTDAKALKEGLFEQAKGGTIFLDEIGELEIGLQAKLLRVLEEEVFRRVGGLKDLPLNACIIAASNRNLRKESETGSFRQDLYFRLSVIEINIPPLRGRGDDVLLLAEHFINKFDRKRFRNKNSRQLAPEVIEVFRNYKWIGNVRELRNAIERSLILEEGEKLTLKYMPLNLNKFNTSISGNDYLESDGNYAVPLPSRGISLKEVQDSLIQQALDRTKGNVTRAGKLLDLSRDQMRYHLKKKNEKAD